MTGIDRPSFDSGFGASPAPPVYETFSSASVVQLISGWPGDIDAGVAPVFDAKLRVNGDRIVASTGGDEWVWLTRDIKRAFYGAHEPWIIFEVPDVPDMGVAVSRRDFTSLRAAIKRVLPLATHVESAPFDPHSFAEVEPATIVDLRSEMSQPEVDRSEMHSNDLTPEPPVDAVIADGQNLPRERLMSEPEFPISGALSVEDDTVVMSLPTLGDKMVQASSTVQVAHPPLIKSSIENVAATGGAASPAKLEALEISAWFGTHQVLEGVSLEMPSGQVTALIGPSGCGKSTFLRILNRMHELVPSASLAGEVLLDGVDLYDPSRRLTQARRQVGMVFQKPNPFPAMSIYDNVLAGFRLTGTKISSSTKDEVVEACLGKAGLWNEVRDRLRSPGGSLSGGQQQRLCIARALAITPRVLLMDEPCSALDPTSTRRIEQTITELASEVTIVIVTHNMQQAARVSNQCAFFLAEQGTPGVIVEQGTTEAIFNTPRDRRTDDYVNGRFG